MISLSDIATQLFVCKSMAIALPRFKKRTSISAQITFKCADEENIEILMGFSPKEPNEEEYSILMEELFRAEKLLSDEHLINTANNYENINQLIFKHKEEINQIIAKDKDLK